MATVSRLDNMAIVRYLRVMGNQKTWLIRNQSKGPDFIGGFPEDAFVTIEVKRSNLGLVANWVTSQFRFSYNPEFDDFENSIKCYIPFILTETYEITSEKELENLLRRKLETLSKLYEDPRGLLPINILQQIDKNIGLEHWKYHRKKYLDLDSEIGIQRRTVFDYLLLQSLGLKDFASYISKEDKVKLLTVRDRLAYARRHGWIKKPGVGVRTSYMNKEN